MNRTGTVAIHEFTWTAEDLARDSGGFNFVYSQGGKLPLSSLAVVVGSADVC